MANLATMATPASRAIYTQTGFADMGTLTLEELNVTGRLVGPTWTIMPARCTA